MRIKFVQKLIDKVRFRKINSKLSKAKYVHLMFNDKFNKPFVDFLNRNFNPKEHLVLCKKWFKEFDFPQGENVIKIKSLKNLDFSKAEKIICHSLFDEELVDYLYNHENILKEKAYWRIWGGDLYNAPRDIKNDYVRKNFYGYIGIIDREYALEKYQMNDNFYKMFYRFPLSQKMLDSAYKIDSNTISIQINNSCDKSTLEMLDVLSKFKNENILIKTILSYGHLEYKDEIIKKGNEIFNKKFEYLEEYISPQDYAQYIAQNDILILNQQRQQGFGNTLASLYLGQKVYIRSNISVNKYLNNDDIKIYNSEDIENMNFEEFIEYSQQRSNNIKNVTKYLQDKYLAELMEKFFYEK